MATLLLRVSVILLVVGLTMGVVMGIRQDFALAPSHGHLNLIGFVFTFLAGLYYRLVPAAAAGMLAKAHVTLQVVGAIMFPLGLALMLGVDRSFEPLVKIGSLIVLLAGVLFAIIVVRTAALPPENARP